MRLPIKLLIFLRLSLLSVVVTVTMNIQPSTSAPPPAKIDPVLWSRLLNGEAANMLVSFGQEDYVTVLERVTATVPPNTERGQRNEAIINALCDHGTRTQEGVVKLLNQRNVAFKQYKESNKMLVRNGTPVIAREIAEDPQVNQIAAEPVGRLAGN